MKTHATDVPAVPAEVLQHALFPIVSGLVHDLRQPLSVMDACADYLNLVLSDADDCSREHLQLLQQQVGEANRILHEALMKAHYQEAPAADTRALTNAASVALLY